MPSTYPLRIGKARWGKGVIDTFKQKLKRKSWGIKVTKNSMITLKSSRVLENWEKKFIGKKFVGKKFVREKCW
jgi:hypothetical protein